jgi:hypothetical protein
MTILEVSRPTLAGHSKSLTERLRALSLGVVLIALTASCSLFPDDRPPEVADAQVQSISRSEESIVLSWAPAEDNRDNPDQLEYRIYARANEPIDSFADIDAATPLGDWTNDTSERSVRIEGVDPGADQTLYVAAVVRDRANNQSLYEDRQVSIPMSTSEGDVYYFSPREDALSDQAYAEIDITLGSGSYDAYLVFTNADRGGAVFPTVNVSSETRFLSERSLTPDPVFRRPAPSGEQAFRGLPSYRESLARFGYTAGPVARAFTGVTDEAGNEGNLGESETFLAYDFSRKTSDPVSATLRRKQSDAGAIAQFWVADALWTSNAAAEDGRINSSRLEEIATRFLDTGTDNDIFEWVSDIYGDPWGPRPTGEGLIKETKVVDILLLDIQDGGESSGSFVAGYFNPRDNFDPAGPNGNGWNDPTGPSNRNESNGRIMFYLDGALYATPDSGQATWSVEQDYPSEIVMTLAHELQHMIHFYQKFVLQTGRPTDTWIEEMLSTVTEDAVADKLGFRGPRGVDPTSFPEGSAGARDIAFGRLPSFVDFPERSLYNWDSSDPQALLYDYASSFAFGSYLARNYGGAELLHEIVRNDEHDSDAVLNAVASLGSPRTMSLLLREWAVATVLSTFSSNGGAYELNSGSWFDSTYAQEDYRFGSINLANYESEVERRAGGEYPAAGILAYGQDLDFGDLGLDDLAPGSNTYYLLSDLAERLKARVELDANTGLTVVVRER